MLGWYWGLTEGALIMYCLVEKTFSSCMGKGEGILKIDRLLGIIILLLQRQKLTAPELASHFEVSRRTIQRDIETLCQAGIPLITIQGHDGGIAIAEGFKLERTVLTQSEMQAILAGLKGIDSVSNTNYLRQFLDKLSMKHSRMMLDDVMMIDLGYFGQQSLVEKIETIKAAALRCQCISFQYYSAKGEEQRVVEPYRLVFHWSSWYVFGYCLDREDFRLFKLNRLWDLILLNDCFTPRAISDERLQFGDYFVHHSAHLKAVFAASEKYRLIEEYGIDSFQQQDDGQLLFERGFVNKTAMLQWVLSFGDKVTVLEPVALKEELLVQARNIIEKSSNMTGR